MNILKNKKLNSLIPKIIILIFLISGVSIAWQGYKLTQVEKSNIVQENPSDKDIVEIFVRSIKNEWRFEPNEIVISAGAKTRLRIFNEDSFNHGFAIKELGIDKTLLPLQETIIEIKTQSPGEYTFVCSVLCGRGHFDQEGKLIVK
jgi:heme/copper-type cytochrome/quinol oxidase subunit 2